MNNILTEAIGEDGLNFRDIYNNLMESTHNFTEESGDFKFDSSFEASLAENILKDKYSEVEIKPLDMDDENELFYTVLYKDPIIKEDYKDLDFQDNKNPEGTPLGSFGESLLSEGQEPAHWAVIKSSGGRGKNGWITNISVEAIPYEIKDMDNLKSFSTWGPNNQHVANRYKADSLGIFSTKKEALEKVKELLRKEPNYRAFGTNAEEVELLEKIIKFGSKWQVQSEKGKNMGTYNTKKEAEDRLKQVEYFKHINESNCLKHKKESDNLEVDETLDKSDLINEDRKSDIESTLLDGEPTFAEYMEDNYGIDIYDDEIAENPDVEDHYLNEYESYLDHLYDLDDESNYDAAHAAEWMERYPHGYYNDEDDYGVDDEDGSPDIDFEEDDVDPDQFLQAYELTRDMDEDEAWESISQRFDNEKDLGFWGPDEAERGKHEVFDYWKEISLKEDFDPEDLVIECPQCLNDLTFVGYQGDLIEFKCDSCENYFYMDPNTKELLSPTELDKRYLTESTKDLYYFKITGPVRKQRGWSPDDEPTVFVTGICDELKGSRGFRDGTHEFRESDLERVGAKVGDTVACHVDWETDYDGHLELEVDVVEKVNESLNEAAPRKTIRVELYYNGELDDTVYFPTLKDAYKFSDEKILEDEEIGLDKISIFYNYTEGFGNMWVNDGRGWLYDRSKYESLNEAVAANQWFIVRTPNGRMKDGKTTKYYISVQRNGAGVEYDETSIPNEVTTWGAHNQRIVRVDKSYIMGIFNNKDQAIQVAKSIIDANDNFFSDLNESLDEAKEDDYKEIKLLKDELGYLAYSAARNPLSDEEKELKKKYEDRLRSLGKKYNLDVHWYVRESLDEAKNKSKALTEEVNLQPGDVKWSWWLHRYLIYKGFDKFSNKYEFEDFGDDLFDLTAEEVSKLKDKYVSKNESLDEAKTQEYEYTLYNTFSKNSFHKKVKCSSKEEAKKIADDELKKLQKNGHFKDFVVKDVKEIQEYLDEGFVGVKGPVTTKYDDKFNLSPKQERIAADIIGACWAIDPYADMYQFTDYTPEMEEFFDGNEPLLDELVKYYVMQGKEKEFLRDIFDIDSQIEEVESWEDPDEESTIEFLKEVKQKYLGGEQDTVMTEAKNEHIDLSMLKSFIGKSVNEVTEYLEQKGIEYKHIPETEDEYESIDVYLPDEDSQGFSLTIEDGKVTYYDYMMYESLDEAKNDTLNADI